MTDTIETTTTVLEASAIENGAVLFVPLNKLKKSPRNARKTPHSEAHIEALAASISAKGMLQNLVVEPETNAEGEPTGFYFVTIGEGRRLAQLLRVKRKQIKKTEAIRCVLDTENDATEISLDENVTREAMHPADQFERFRELAENRGWGAEDIAARFGVSAHVVRQRLRLGAVSPKLMQVYREGGLSLDQLMAFALTEDHARQVQVYENLSWNRDPSTIRRDLTKMNVAATDRQAIFVGADAYAEAGGTIIRDLFTEDRGGYFEDAALLDRLVIDKLEGIAAEVQAVEGWKWASVHIDFPHAHGMRRSYPHPVDLSADDDAAFGAAQEDYDRLSSEYEGYEELPDEVDRRFGELEAEIERIDARRHAYDAHEIARGGVFVILNHDGTARIERGFIRAEDEAPKSADVEGATITEDGEIVGEGSDEDAEPQPDDEEVEDAGKPLSDLLIRDLTAHRTLGLRLALGEQPAMALVAVVHALAAQTFYRGGEASCLEIRLTSAYLASHADGIEDTPAAKALADRHAGWASDMPRDVADLWTFVAGLDHASVMALLAHCAALTVNAVRIPWEQKPNARATAEKLASAVTLDMKAHWTPTVQSYLGRVTKAHILNAVREGVGDEAAERIAGLKKAEMAQAAEQLLAGTGWLPSVLRTARPLSRDAESEAGAIAQAAE
ncbi:MULTISPECIES: ParB/RepB/Spo0J family partition protein [unclassified Xanthobacter]|uniref:ParB/RepB/Spo0J family partition protein n=1 Tax=unclassified Xanthobacter TaxID=2623496 RepID=UPI001F2F6643|nr:MULTISPECIES: ParB/RepB/Spo0J family partition protein [unclassified Xanthobacter]